MQLSPPPAVADIWAAQPGPADIRNATGWYAHGLDRAGKASMRCYGDASGQLRSCKLLQATGDDPRFGESLLKLAPLYRLRASAVQRGEPIVVQTTFPKLLDRTPKRLQEPKPERIRDVFPKGAYGHVSLRCTLDEGGRLTACGPDPTDTDANAGVVPSAVQASLDYRYQPPVLGGRPTSVPWTVTMTVRPESARPLDWVRKPAGEDLQAAWPRLALERGIGGRGVITCDVTGSGALANCHVVDEEPLGLGFGTAALLLSPTFRMTPPTAADGHDPKVTIPINFANPGGPTPPQNLLSVKVMSWAPLEAAPTQANVRDAYPPAAAAAKLAGHVAFRCRFTHAGALNACDLIDARGGDTFTSSARRLLSKFRVRLGNLKGVDLSETRVNIAIDFAPELLDAGTPRYLRDIDWTQGISGAEVIAAYPPAAVKAGVGSGAATLDCEVGSQGEMADWRVLTESPAGLDFGGAAVTVAHAMRLNLWTRSGEPAAGARLRLPIRLVLPSGDAEPSAPKPGG